MGVSVKSVGPAVTWCGWWVGVKSVRMVMTWCGC